MASNVVRYYWDSCVFLSVISPDPGLPDRLPAVVHLLQEAENRTVEIVTSSLTIAEVAFSASEKSGQSLDPAVEADVDALWAPGGPVRMVEYGRQTGLRARGLIRAGVAAGRALKPIDAVHLASAWAAGASELHSYDGPLAKYQSVPSQLPYTVGEPPPPPNTMFGVNVRSQQP